MKSKDNNPNLHLLKPPKAKSENGLIDALKRSITQARHHKMTSVSVVMVKHDGTKYIDTYVPINSQDLDELLDAIEDAHEVVYQIGK